MKYSDIKEIAESKNIQLKFICYKVGYTRAGLKPAIDNETIELRKLKLLCEVLGITIEQFLIIGSSGININTGHIQAGNGNKMNIENKDKEIYMLREQIADKTEIIRMLREKLDLGIAATPKNTYKNKGE